MTRERGVPQRRGKGAQRKPTRPADRRVAGDASQSNARRTDARRTDAQRTDAPRADAPRFIAAPLSSRPPVQPWDTEMQPPLVHPEAEVPGNTTAPRQPPVRPRRSWFGFLKSWSFWGVTGTVAFVGTGAIAAALLLKLPAIPNCPETFWPTASASLRLYCGQLAANKQTVDDLLEAIALVDTLPTDHPLRPEVNRSIEQWSRQILDLAGKTFHRGDLDGAIAIANRIPKNTPAYKEVNEQVSDWRQVWTTAEGIYDKAEAALVDQDPRKAFEFAVQLLTVGNRYWETTKYQELNDLITASREDGRRLGQIRRLMARGGLSNLLEAAKVLREIKPNSPAYPVVKRLMTQLGEKMLDLAEDALDRRDSSQALDIIRQIPPDANLQEAIRDFNLLAQAQNQAWNGTISDLESAILQAQRVGSDRPLFGRAQRLIGRWQLEIQDVSRLDAARQLADAGDLRGAIAEASRIPRGNPRRAEARELLGGWLNTVEIQEDQPVLDQADQLAASGNLNDLQSGVNLLQRIDRGRALSDEARSRIRNWTRQIQETQDQPILDQARALAAGGNIPEAIATANRIRAGRALYDQAQDEVRTWESQIAGQTRLQRAIEVANLGTAQSFLDAIDIARRVPNSSSARSEADRLINRWSVGVLRAAQSQSAVDPQGAIALLEAIPANTEAYPEAQLQLANLRQAIAPAPLPPLDLSPPTELLPAPLPQEQN